MFFRSAAGVNSSIPSFRTGTMGMYRKLIFISPDSMREISIRSFRSAFSRPACWCAFSRNSRLTDGIVDGAVEEGLQESLERENRRPQFVGHIAEKLAPDPFELSELDDVIAQFSAMSLMRAARVPISSLRGDRRCAGRDRRHGSRVPWSQSQEWDGDPPRDPGADDDDHPGEKSDPPDDRLDLVVERRMISTYRSAVRTYSVSSPREAAGVAGSLPRTEIPHPPWR